jgi:hypothetical protein
VSERDEGPRLEDLVTGPTGDLDPAMVELVEPDLARFTARAPPSGTPRGRPGIWPRFEQMLNQVPGQWLNATKAWGLKASASSGARNSMRRLELRGEVRVVNRDLWIRVE